MELSYSCGVWVDWSVIVWKFSVLRGCLFPGPPTRQSRFSRSCFFPCSLAFTGYLSPKTGCMKQRKPRELTAMSSTGSQILSWCVFSTFRGYHVFLLYVRSKVYIVSLGYHWEGLELEKYGEKSYNHESAVNLSLEQEKMSFNLPCVTLPIRVWKLAITYRSWGQKQKTREAFLAMPRY